jgi:hypothetical protein
MRTPLATGFAFASLTLAACGGGGGRAVEIDPQQPIVGSRWNATLGSPAGLAGVSSVRGTGWMGGEDEESSNTRAEVSINNAVPGAEHPWHVHIGQCGSDRGIFGPAEAYRPLEVNGDGEAESSAELNVALPRSGQYFINVHASRENMGTIVACGNLAPPMR